MAVAGSGEVVISKIHRGANVHGLVAYLWGTGRKHEDHTNPRFIAGSDGDAFDSLVNAKERSAALSTWLDTLPERPPKHVWHCSVRLAPGERLDPEQWAEVAERVIAAAGISTGPGDPDGCEWVAMAHDDVDRQGDKTKIPDGQHIHIAAVLVAPDGSRVRAFNDFRNVGEECRLMEDEFGLVQTGARDGTAHPAMDRVDVERQRELDEAIERGDRAAVESKANKDPAEFDKLDVRNLVLQAAAESTNWEEFHLRLTDEGVVVHPRYSTIVEGQVTGYSVEIPKTGLKVAGGKLGRGLSYNKLTEAWSDLEHGRGTGDELRQVRSRQDQGQDNLTRAIMDASLSPDDDTADALGTVLQVGQRYDEHLVAAAQQWERARYSAQRRTRSKAGKAIRLSLNQMERGRFNPNLLLAIIELAAAIRQRYALEKRFKQSKAAAIEQHLVRARQSAAATPKKQQDMAIGSLDDERPGGPRRAGRKDDGPDNTIQGPAR